MPIQWRARGEDGGDLFEPLQIDFLGLGLVRIMLPGCTIMTTAEVN